jgi:glycosyltransferase involved in cell wall biosynthesis/O-antigen/teichoic acid export membrane protein
VIRPTHLFSHFAGAAVTKLAPPVVQLVLLLLVARESTLNDVGRLALASAVSFLCGALAELGFATTLSIPRPTFGTAAPPLRATARVRVLAAVAGSLLYLAFWAAGIGGHDAALLLALPLPFSLALSYGYSGAMNASGLLRIEGVVSVAESAAILVVAVVGSRFGSALAWSLAALTIGRAGGTVARALLVRTLPQSPVRTVGGLFRPQLPFALATLALVFQGQVDMLAIGFFGSLALAGLYGPLVRTAYSTLLSAEAFSWGLYGDAHPEERPSGSLLAGHWRSAGIGLGLLLAVGFVLLAEPFLRFLLDRPLPDLTLPVALFSLVIVLRFAALVLNVEILRAGRQREEIPVLFVATIALAVGGTVAARAASIAGLAGARLASEAITAAGYFALTRRGPSGARRRHRAAPDGQPRAPGARLRLLFAAPFPPSLDGAHGGSRVIAQLLVRMAERHDVALVCLRRPDDQPVDAALRALLDRVEEVELPASSASGAARLLGGLRTRLRLLAGRPLWSSEVDVPAYRERLRAVLREWRPDVIQIEYTVMGTHLEEMEAAGIPIVLGEPDPATNAAIDLERISDRHRLRRRLDVRAWRRFERDVLKRVDAAVVFTERDAQTLVAQAPGIEVIRIPFGTDYAEKRPPAATGDGDVLFVGSFVHFPNVDAARRLMLEIFPRVRERHPASSLYIVGEDPPTELRDATDGHVIVTGRVPDIGPYVERAAVVAVPIRLGGGMRVKVLEALAAGKPVVASPLAVEGLDVVDGDQLLTAETDDEFADRICLVLGDDRLRVRLGARARAWAEENLTWERSVEEYERLYRRLCTRRS